MLTLLQAVFVVMFGLAVTLPPGYYYPDFPDATQAKKDACRDKAQGVYRGEADPENRQFLRIQEVDVYVACMNAGK